MGAASNGACGSKRVERNLIYIRGGAGARNSVVYIRKM
jgi:hypothetical protein